MTSRIIKFEYLYDNALFKMTMCRITKWSKETIIKKMFGQKGLSNKFQRLTIFPKKIEIK